MQQHMPPLDGENKMAEYWLQVDYVGFNRAFLVGSTPEHKVYERELNVDEKRALEDFNYKQQRELEMFLQELAKNATD